MCQYHNCIHRKSQEIYNFCDKGSITFYNTFSLIFVYVSFNYLTCVCNLLYSLFRKIMSPKRKSKASIKQDQPDKKVHLLKNENLDTNHKDGFGDKNKAGKEFNFTMKQENNDSIPKKKYGHQELSDIDQKPDEAEFSSLELNQLLQQKSKLSLQGLVCWKIFLFPKITQIGSISNESLSYFGLDLVEEETERTVWTHKASVWKDIVQSIFELAERGRTCPSINKIFHGLLAGPVRAVPNGPNEPESFKSAKGQSIQHWIMLIPMPADMDTSEYIPLFISEFTSLSKKAYIRSAYHYQVSNISKHPALLNQIDANGSYWNIIDKACHKEVITQHSNSLSEVLMNSTIKDVISIGLKVSKDTNVWSDSIKHYAFGV